jgi:hypothetical protein
MFDVFFDLRRRVLWTTISGTFSSDDLAIMDEIGQIILNAEGPMSCVFDFSAAEKTDVAIDEIERRAKRPRNPSSVRRIIVASHPDILRLAQAFVTTQQAIGSDAPGIVHSAAEARKLLEIDTELRRAKIDWLRDILLAERSG